MIAGAFHSFGAHSVVVRPVRLAGERRISIGSGVYIGAGCWLQTLEAGHVPCIVIGDQVEIAGQCVISSVLSVIVEEDVLLARNVYIADHSHRFVDTSVPIHLQGTDKIAPVVIKKGAWLGQNVVVCPGVTVGRNSVVGANSVVRKDVPDYCVAVGSPAVVIKDMTCAPRCK